MNVLMVDVGGTNVKVMARHDGEMRKVPSGKTLTASEMVRAVLELAKGMEFDRISLGYPALGRKWGASSLTGQSGSRMGGLRLLPSVRETGALY